MPHLLVLAIALFWLVALSAAWRRARAGRRVAGFGRRMWALRSNHEVRRSGGRWILVPYRPLGRDRARPPLRRRSF